MTADVLEIVEIIGPSEQGQQKPYKCRGEDGAIYFVKGRQTNRASLWHEWICAHLAQAFGLQVPEAALVNVSDELLQEVVSDWRDLGSGIAFGSKIHSPAAWMEPSMVCMVPTQVQQDVLVFDWWVRNSDRMTYNSNLLWDSGAEQLVVIDHNMAFDDAFSAPEFFTHHIFARQWSAIAGDLVTQDTFAQRLCAARHAALQRACDNIPDQWHWENIEFDLPARVDLDAIRVFLSRCESPELWRTS